MKEILPCVTAPGTKAAATELRKMNAAPSLIRNLIIEATRLLESRNVPSPRLEADLLLAHSLGIERMALYKNPDKLMTANEQKKFIELLEQRASGVPTAYLRGKKEFFSRTFQVGSVVLIPRMETELVVEEALALIQQTPTPSVLDLGTGSGAILISILLERVDATGVGVESSSEALAFAFSNAKLHKVTDRIHLIQGNLFEPINPQSKFDLIVSNPPYIPTDKIPDELKFEPREAFDGGADGLEYYHEIIERGWYFLKPTGSLVLEIGIDNRPPLDELIARHQNNYENPVYKKDLAGIDRVLILRKKK